MRGRQKGAHVGGLRLCAILDALRVACPHPCSYETFALRFGVSTRTIHRDVQALATAYPIEMRLGTVRMKARAA